ncbi:hypothetical protein Leucomu_03640 [Leucobacter muris]|uniref:Transcriptional regulator n=1 Tax=Leucobacter muris TaxID=1935379 RepID=A0ABX5QDJ5_9MICO|nr:hypothetical protein [Leucobacter muris]QAB17135.1 hypothetical protein Leucomu_03640 [Leucobacter muris]
MLTLANTERKQQHKVKPRKPPEGVRDRERRAADAASHAATFWEQDKAFQEAKAAGATWGDL